MYETLLRPHEVSTVPPLLPLSAVSHRLRRSEHKREEKRQRQLAGSRHFTKAPDGGAKRKREDDGRDEKLVDGEGSTLKRSKSISETSPQALGEDSVVFAEDNIVLGEDSMDFGEDSIDFGPTILRDSHDTLIDSLPTPPLARLNVSKGMPEVRGHTSYLTFACLLPLPLPQAGGSEQSGQLEGMLATPS